LSRLCVRRALRSGEFPLASPLPSTTSAAGSSALFGGFPGTTRLSDFPRPSIIGVRPRTSRCACGPLDRRQTRDLPVPGRGASGHAWGLRPRGVLGRLALTASPVWPSASIHRVGTPKYPPLAQRGKRFRGSIPSLHVPLPTLHPRPCGRARMTQGQSGSLLLSLCGSYIV